MSNLKDLFLLNPDVIYLNHGSFGATPRAVMDVYQEWQRRLEQQPVHFIVRELPNYFKQARAILGRYLNAQTDDLVFIPNATFGVNVICMSLNLSKRAEILASNHEYGACDKAWDYLCQKSSATYIRQPISLPVSSQENIIDQNLAKGHASHQTDLSEPYHFTDCADHARK